jgi:TRAP transporter TAXI family solute receptor
MRTFSFRFAAALVAMLGWIAPSIAAEPNWPDHMTIGTASPGGTYYVYGEALAKILTRALDIAVGRQATEGPVENIELLQAGDVQLAFVTTGVALQAWNATGVWAGRPPARSVRALFPIYDTPFVFLVLRDSGITSISGIAGKRVGVGPPGGTSATYALEFFGTLNVEAELVFGDYADLATQLREKKIDAFFAAAGAPFPSFVELEAKTKVRYLPLSAEQISKLRLVMPELTPTRVPAGTYPSLLQHYETVGLYNFAVARADLSTDLAYQIVKAVFDNQQVLMEAHPAAAATIPANIDRNSFLPLHPGAIRYYQRIGKAGLSD